MSEKYAFYCVPPTPNGDLHLGHLSGPYLGADVLARYLRGRGDTVTMLTGLDDYQSYVRRKGIELNEAPEDVAERYGQMVRSSWKSAGIEFDLIVQSSTNSGYKNFVQNKFADLRASGAVSNRDIRHLFSDKNGFVYQGMVNGLCPWCGVSSDGNICEACSMPNECSNLEGVRSVFKGDALTTGPARRSYFQLRDTTAAEKVKAWHSNVRCDPSMRRYFEKFWASGCSNVSVTHDTCWGLEDNLEGASRIDVWFEMGLGFLYYAEAAFGDWKEAWCGGRKTAFFYGYDNSFYTSVLFPETYMALNVGLELPHALHVNHFLNLEGQKFSTSRNHAIWGSDFFNPSNLNWARLFLGSVRSESVRTNFALDEYKSFESRSREKWNTSIANLRSAANSLGIRDRKTSSRSCNVLPIELLDRLSHIVEGINASMDPDVYRLSNASLWLREAFDVVTDFCLGVDRASAGQVEAGFALLAGVAEIARPWMPAIRMDAENKADLGESPTPVGLPPMIISLSSTIEI